MAALESDDVLFSIFRWCPVETLANVSLVSRHWRDVAQEPELWKHLALRDYGEVLCGDVTTYRQTYRELTFCFMDDASPDFAFTDNSRRRSASQRGSGWLMLRNRVVMTKGTYAFTISFVNHQTLIGVREHDIPGENVQQPNLYATPSGYYLTAHCYRVFHGSNYCTKQLASNPPSNAKHEPITVTTVVEFQSATGLADVYWVIDGHCTDKVSGIRGPLRFAVLRAQGGSVTFEKMARRSPVRSPTSIAAQAE
eukprot:TRINITY_DN692_c0_g1_i3.p1 TRINITY_DN692_c0_g1~~TRINITY_DN692_c0_g1_i3.p1  ORF type:complete len:260 (-),score=42.45 TRINITY_DN692_c0_g1_i3:575-1333(-)